MLIKFVCDMSLLYVIVSFRVVLFLRSHTDSDVRSRALEVLCSAVEGKPKMMLKVPACLDRIFEICVQKGSEFQKGDKRQKYKGRSVFDGSKVKDQNYTQAIFDFTRVQGNSC